MTTAGQERPLTIAVLALGGQGGGVLTKWLVDTAEANDYLAQSTYVAGVAQRTGTTVYCIELFASDAAKKQGQEPVFTPYPVPGDVDLVITGEMAETGRAIQKGFVSPETTTLIASSHRVYSIIEKEALDDGILDQSPVADMAMKAAKKFICFDMDAAAEETGSIISSVMLGAPKVSVIDIYSIKCQFCLHETGQSGSIQPDLDEISARRSLARADSRCGGPLLRGSRLPTHALRRRGEAGRGLAGPGLQLLRQQTEPAIRGPQSGARRLAAERRARDRPGRRRGCQATSDASTHVVVCSDPSTASGDPCR